MSMPAEDPIARYQEAMAANQAANPNPTPKQLLDAFRAMNGGQLPPGMTPEQAMLIDMGLASNAIAQNPAIAPLLQQLAQQRIQQKADFAAARQQVGDNYQNLTGDVEQQGTAFMADLAKAMGLTPEQMAMDPSVNSYSQTITNMGETADQNQATDQAWFDKMAQVYDQSLQSQMLGLANPVVDAGGGGGGGGGGRGGGYGRRGYGGGGGSGGGDWKDPKTTDTLNMAADTNAVENFPGFAAAFLDVGQTPEEVEFLKGVKDELGGFPHNVSKGIAGNLLPSVNTALEAMIAQQAQKRLFAARLPVMSATAQDRVHATANQAAMAKENATPFVQEEPDRRNMSMDLSSAILNIMANAYEQEPGGRPDRWKREVAPGVNLPEALRHNSQYVQQEKERMLYEEAEDAGTTADPFSLEGWEGYVPQVNAKDAVDANWQRGLLAKALEVSRAFDPNNGMNVTKNTMQDSSDYKTTQSTYDENAALLNNNEDFALPLLQDSQDVAGGSGALDLQGNGAAGFGMGRSVGGNTSLSEAAQRIIANRLQKVQEAGQSNAAVGGTGGQSGWSDALNPGRVRRTAKKSVAKKAPAKKSVGWGGLAKKAASGGVAKKSSGWDAFSKKPWGNKPKKKAVKKNSTRALRRF